MQPQARGESGRYAHTLPELVNLILGLSALIKSFKRLTQEGKANYAVVRRPCTRITSLSDSPGLQLYKLEITTAASKGKLEIDPRLTGLPGLKSLVLKITYFHSQHFLSKCVHLQGKWGWKAYSPGTRIPKDSPCAAR